MKKLKTLHLFIILTSVIITMLYELYNVLSSIGAIIATVLILPLVILYDITGWRFFNVILKHYFSCVKKYFNVKD